MQSLSGRRDVLAIPVVSNRQRFVERESWLEAQSRQTRDIVCTQFLAIRLCRIPFHAAAEARNLAKRVDGMPDRVRLTGRQIDCARVIFGDKTKRVRSVATEEKIPFSLPRPPDGNGLP